MNKYICPIGFVIDAPKLDGKGCLDGKGVKHFASNQKVYILPMHSYDVAYCERVKVAGYHRDGKISVVWLDLRRLEKFASEEVNDPEIRSIISELQKNNEIKTWKVEIANEFIDWRNKVDAKDWIEENRKNMPKEPHPNDAFFKKKF